MVWCSMKSCDMVWCVVLCVLVGTVRRGVVCSSVVQCVVLCWAVLLCVLECSALP